MPKIICQWTTCKFNSAEFTSENYGQCKREIVYLDHVDNSEYVKNGELVLEGLKCFQYENDKSKKHKVI